MSKLKVLISGAGIAGGVFASCLLRANINASITIVERTPTLRLTGASVDIRSSAVDVIKWMGAEQEIRNHTTNEAGVQFVNADGKEVATIQATGRTDIQTFTSEFEIFRGELAKIFIDPIIPKVNLIFDESVDHFEQNDDGVVVTFTKSKEVKTYDLLVAADGLGSKIRGMMLNTNSQEQIHDPGVHAAYFTMKSDVLQGDGLAKWLSTTGGRNILLRPDPNPAGRTRANIIKVTTKKDTETRERLNKALREGSESYMKLMEEMFHDVGWIAPEVLRSMRESDDFYCSLFGQVRSPKLQVGRVVLLGDAGYATPGIGTSLAIMGGYVLAGELLSLGDSGDIKTALKKYEELMLPFAKGSQGGMLGDYATDLASPQTQWGITIRNAFLSFVTRTKLNLLVMAVGSKLGFAEKKLAMPDYQWPAA